MIGLPSFKNIYNDCFVRTTDGTQIFYPTDYSVAYAGQFLFNNYVVLGSKITQCGSMFAECRNFNQPITIPNNVTDCTYMFSNCQQFNQPITIPNNVTNCEGMFWNCCNFNQPVTMSDNIEYCSHMFWNCCNFNQPVIISDKAIYCRSMFNNCTNLNQSIVVGKNIIDCEGMLEGCDNFGQNIYFKRKDFYEYFTVSLLLFNTNKLKRKNIWFNNVLNNRFNISTGGSLVGPPITWTPMADGHGFYNTAFNVYCYNIYVP